MTTKGILDALEKYFQPSVNIRYERYRFNTAHQHTNETVEAYTCRLRELIKSCAYPSQYEDEYICDRLIPGILCNDMRRKLLMEDNLTLEKAIKMCSLAEQTSQRLEQMTMQQGREITEPKEINIVSKAKPKGRKQEVSKYATSRAISDKRSCDYCGNTHDKRKCPAYGKVCRNCKQKNHFSRMCRKQKCRGNVNAVTDDIQADSSEEDILYVALVNKGSLSNAMIVREVEFSCREKHAVKLQCIADTGASCNIMHIDDYLKIAGDNSGIHKSNVKLKSFGGHLIKPIGYGKLRARHEGILSTLDFQLVRNKCIPILPTQTSKDFNIVQGRSVSEKREEVKETIKHPILRKYYDVFEGDGLLEGSVKLEIDTNIAPTQQQPRRIPIALRQELK